MGRELEAFQMLTLVMCLLNKDGGNAFKYQAATLHDRQRRACGCRPGDAGASRLFALHLHLDVRSRTIAEFVDMMAEFGELVLPLVGNFEASAL